MNSYGPNNSILGFTLGKHLFVQGSMYNKLRWEKDNNLKVNYWDTS